jgi:hypothetical protein
VRTGICQRLSKNQRAATPIEFRDLLIAMVNPVLEQSDLVGACTMGHAGRPQRFHVPNSEFDSRDGGQSINPHKPER